jgi:hypothetical protein
MMNVVMGVALNICMHLCDSTPTLTAWIMDLFLEFYSQIGKSDASFFSFFLSLYNYLSIAWSCHSWIPPQNLNQCGLHTVFMAISNDNPCHEQVAGLVISHMTLFDTRRRKNCHFQGHPRMTGIFQTYIWDFMMMWSCLIMWKRYCFFIDKVNYWCNSRL